MCRCPPANPPHAMGAVHVALTSCGRHTAHAQDMPLLSGDHVAQSRARRSQRLQHTCSAMPSLLISTICPATRPSAPTALPTSHTTCGAHAHGHKARILSTLLASTHAKQYIGPPAGFLCCTKAGTLGPAESSSIIGADSLVSSHAFQQAGVAGMRMLSQDPTRSRRVQGVPHPHYTLRRHTAGLSADVFECQRQQCIARQDGHILSIHLKPTVTPSHPSCKPTTEACRTPNTVSDTM